MTDGSSALVLIVEDDRTIALGLAQHLRHAGYHVMLAGTGGAALEAVRRTPPALVILDLMLPDLDGFEVLRTWRARGDQMPVLVLTARDSESHAVQGFGLGADDYVAKPFRVREVLARVAALLRRATGTRPDPGAPLAPSWVPGPRAVPELPPRLRFGNIDVDTRACAVRRNGQPVPLRPKEYDLLVALLARRGEVVSRSTLLRDVWGYDPMVVSRTVETHILELRRKLEAEPSRPVHILTVRTRGYRLSLE
ncbi:MAG: response regulator receiver [Gemmatimonadetes bacterium]|nr:response regulator receiver [Gemmatimonadota bacterium]